MTPDHKALREKIRAIVDDAVNSAIPEPWEVTDHATDRILALLSPAPAEGEGLRRVALEAASYIEGDASFAFSGPVGDDIAERLRSAAPTPTPATPDISGLVEACENLLIAIGMGWDTKGCEEAARAELAKLGRV